MNEIPISYDEGRSREKNMQRLEEYAKKHDSHEGNIKDEFEDTLKCKNCNQYLCIACKPDLKLAEELQRSAYKAPYGLCNDCFTEWFWDTQMKREEKANG